MPKAARRFQRFQVADIYQRLTSAPLRNRVVEKGAEPGQPRRGVGARPVFAADPARVTKVVDQIKQIGVIDLPV